MDRYFYEIVHAPFGTNVARRVEKWIQSDPILRTAAERWNKGLEPSMAEIYVCVLVVSDDISGNREIEAKINSLYDQGLNIIPVVESCAVYDFRAAPLRAISALDAVGIDDPLKLIDSLLHHGGLRHRGREGKVFISYARDDGSDLALAIDGELTRVGFQCFRDVRDVAAGMDIQPHITDELLASTLVVLVDSQGAARSEWVGVEIDLARAHHVPVVAVTPTSEGFAHHFGVPHVAWTSRGGLPALAARVANECRRVLARRGSFESRAKRTIAHICRRRCWKLETHSNPWQIEVQPLVRIRCREEEPAAGDVQDFTEQLKRSGARGVLVAGTKPYTPVTRRAFAKLGDETLRVTPLSGVATSISALQTQPLAGRRIFLSAAMPDDDQSEGANHTLAPFVVVFIQTMLELGATVVFGGHPSVTPLVRRAIVEFGLESKGTVELHQARYWLAQGGLLPAAEDFKPSFHGVGKDIVADIAALRNGMIRPGLDGAVFVGGKTKTTLSTRPGIEDEYLRFRSACPDKPAFVLGLAGGAAETLGSSASVHVDEISAVELMRTRDPDLAAAVIVAGLVGVP